MDLRKSLKIRHGRSYHYYCQSTFPVSSWSCNIIRVKATIADAILDRLVHSCRNIRIELKGNSPLEKKTVNIVMSLSFVNQIARRVNTTRMGGSVSIEIHAYHNGVTYEAQSATIMGVKDKNE